MGRAPHNGAPQRVSAHVVPKALSPFADEDEKTTIESGWEEEASTTVEQGEVAEKIRTLGLRPITNVTGTSGGMDEPTMDDQRAAAGLSLITPPMLQARMIITAGNDQGQEIELIPGKTYTVGRAIDNDIVLTDIAVSRKHFDLKFENGWVLVDRRSGNGTVINGNIEDAPFVLANGDAIEIGNTTFRFDHPNGVARSSFDDRSSFSTGTGGFGTADAVTRDGGGGGGGGYEIEEEEPSTVAGKPLREALEPPAHLEAGFGRARSHDRAISARPEPPPPQLPPQPPRAAVRPKTMPPPMPPPAPLPRAKPPTSAPPFLGGAVAPVSQPMPAMQVPAMLHSPPPMLVHGGVHGSQPVPAIGSNRPTMLANSATPIEQQPYLGNMLPTTIPGQGPPVQPANPQIHALPFTYPTMANMAEHHASAQQHAKMLVVGNQAPRDATATAHVPPTPYNGMPALQPQQQPYRAPHNHRRARVLLLGGAALAALAAIVTIVIIKSSGPDLPETPTTEADTPAAKQTTKPTAQPIDEPKKPVVTKVAPKDPPKEIKKDPPKDLPKDPPKIVAKDPPKDLPKDPPKIVAKDPPKDPPKVVAKDPPKKDPPKVVAKDPPKKDPVRVATAAPAGDVAGAADKAKTLYAQKKFLEASTTLKAAAGNDATLRALAIGYSNFARDYAIGTRPTAKPLEAWSALRTALNFDTNYGGGVHREDIQGRRAQIAPKAALALASAKNYTEAAVALKLADSSNGDAQFARRLVNDYAAELYEAAKAEIDSNRNAALTKLRLVKQLTGTGALFNKAEKLLVANAS